jgi:hypothetical protein
MTAKLLLSAFGLAIGGNAIANTYVVDAGGGGDFASISAAVAFAAAGDVLLVQPGTYGAFTLDKGVSVLGTSGVIVAGAVLVSNVPAGPRAGLQRMTLSELDIVDCVGAVLVGEVAVQPPGVYVSLANSAYVHVRGSSDVRLRAVTAWPNNVYEIGWHGIRVESSRVEITHSLAKGRTSPFVDIGTASGGYDGLRVEGTSNVHVSLSTFEGGVGGGATNGGNPWLGGFGGPGGAGIRALGFAQVLVTGRASDEARGGRGGLADDCEHDGRPSSGIVNDSASSYVRHSGITAIGATTYSDCGSSPWPPFFGQHELAVPIDASLHVGGGTSAGTTALFTLRGEPGDAARLRLGRQLAIVDLLDVYEDRLLVPLRTYDLGTLPASGEATFSFPLPATLPSGFLIVAQGSCVSTSGVTRLSQSVPIVLR